MHIHDELKQLMPLAEDDPWLFNKKLNELEFRERAIYLKSYPLDMSIAFYDSCNARCLFCSYWDATPRFITAAELMEYKEIFSRLCYVGINPAGEPLLHPDFDTLIPMIRQMIDKRCWFYLVTNGVLLKDKLEVILHNINTLTVSLNAATAQTHFEIMGIKSKFEAIIDSLREIIRIRNKESLSLNIYTTFVVLKNNIHEIPAFIKLCETLKIDRIYFRNLATANSNNPIKPAENPNYTFIQPVLHPDFQFYLKRAKAAIRKAKIDVVAEPHKWQEDITAPINKENSNRVLRHDWIKLPKNSFPLSCQYLYKYMIDPRLSQVQPVCVYMEHLPGYKPVRLDLKNFFKIRNAEPMLKLRKALKEGPAVPSICTRCNILEAFKHSET